MTEKLRDMTDELETQLAGNVIVAGEPGYDEARRVWNGMIDRRPKLIVRAGSTSDIAPAIAYARANELRLAVRGGGHNVAGNGTVEQGLVLDLGDLTQVKVDAQEQTVTVGPGATIGDVDRATQQHGLVVPIGVVSGTGVTGLTLGGGFGWLTRAYGLSIDNVLAAELITADGRPVRAAADENEELFWGLRGGGGNFGVVSSLTFRAHRLGPQVFSGNLIYGRQRWPEALGAYADWTANLPDALTSIVTFLVPPPAWELGDEVVMVVGFAWADSDFEAGRQAVAPLLHAAPADTKIIEPTAWVDWQSQVDDLFPKGSRAYWKNAAFNDLRAAADVLMEHSSAIGSGSAVDIHHMGGAFGRVPDEATAFPNRSAQYWLNIYGYWHDQTEDERLTAWVRGFHEAMGPYASVGEYVNFLGNEGKKADPRAQALMAYGPHKLKRLVELKRRYDPQNVFRLNHNIPVG